MIEQSQFDEGALSAASRLMPAPLEALFPSCLESSVALLEQSPPRLPRLRWRCSSWCVLLVKARTKIGTNLRRVAESPRPNGPISLSQHAR